jgi:hypothetical protein
MRPLVSVQYLVCNARETGREKYYTTITITITITWYILYGMIVPVLDFKSDAIFGSLLLPLKCNGSSAICQRD